MRKTIALLALTVGTLFALIVVGAYVAAGDFGEACGSSVPADWPGCLGGLFPPLQFGPVVEYTHRLLAAFSGLFLLITTVLVWRDKALASPTKKVVAASMLLLVFQILLGGMVVAQSLEAALVALHQAIAVLIFGLELVALSVNVGRH